MVNGETVAVVAGTGTFARPNVGNWAVTATGYSLGGANAGNYVLAAQPVVPNATIRLGGSPAPTTSRTYNLGPQGGGTTINVAKGPGSMGNLIPWITPGTLPPCSVLRSVSANIRLDSATADSWTSDFLLYVDVDPAAAGTAALMQIGGDYSGKVGTVAQKLAWGMGNGGPGTTITATKTAGVDWSGDIDLNAYQFSLGNNYATATWSGTVTVEYDVSGPPAAPANLLAAAGNNHIDLTWTVSPGANSYYVKRSQANGGPYTVLANPTTANYTDLTAINGTTYYYVVSAINVAGESANSNQASGTPALVPSATALVSSPAATGPYGTAVTFTATVTVSGGPATGTVTFKDGTTVLGSGTLDGNGQTIYTPGTLAVANHSITATYGGDSTFGGSVSAPYAYLVSAKALTITGVTASNKEYNGNAAATLTGGAVAGGLVGSETVTVVPGTGTFASPNAGTWAVTASGYALGGGSAGNYVLSAQPGVANASITARPLVLAGTRVYDATASATAANLTISNKLSGDDLTLTGSDDLAGKDVGPQAFLANSATPARVQSATGSTGSIANTTFNVNLATSPLAGNTLVAVIATRGTSANRVSVISGGGVTWSRVSQGTNTSGTTTEIWYGPNVSSGSTGIAVTQASLRSAAVVIEYSGLLAPTSFDLAANQTGSSNAAVTGTTATTSQSNELWIGGIGIADGRRTLNAPYGNDFTVVAFPKSGSASGDSMIYALEKIVSTTGAASSDGTLNVSDSWSGAIATFKAASTNTLTLTGSAAGNYTLAGLSGSVTITPKALTVTGLTANNKVYDGTPAATLNGTAAFLTSEAAGAGTTGDGKPYTGDTVSPGGSAAGAFANPTVGTAKAMSVTGVTVTGSGSGNYTLTQPTGLTGAITPADLTVTANNQSKTYGQTLIFGSGSTQFTSSGLQDGETIGSVTLSCSGGDAAAEAGGSPYPITPAAATGGTFAAGNYTINYVSGVLTVDAAATAITLTTSGSPSTYGIPVTLTATVVPTLAGGTVQFHDNAVALGSPVPLSGGQAQLVINTLATGSHPITATYSGNTNFNGSTATAMTQTVDKALATITTSPTASDITYGQTLANSILSGGVGSVPGTFAFTDPATAPSAGTASHSVTFTPGDTDNYQAATVSVSVTVNAAQTSFEAWASDPAQGLTAGVNDGPLDDPDRDGFTNLLEFALGGGPMAPSQAIRPKLTQSGGSWVFSYERSGHAKTTTTQLVEYGNDLTGWTPLTIPADSAGAVTITPGPSSDHVEVSIPPQGATSFVRLKVSQ